jgi:hypothetical protein
MDAQALDFPVVEMGSKKDAPQAFGSNSLCDIHRHCLPCTAEGSPHKVVLHFDDMFSTLFMSLIISCSNT